MCHVLFLWPLGFPVNRWRSPKFFMFNYVVNMLIPFYELCGPSTGVSSGNWFLPHLACWLSFRKPCCFDSVLKCKGWSVVLSLSLTLRVSFWPFDDPVTNTQQKEADLLQTFFPLQEQHVFCNVCAWSCEWYNSDIMPNCGLVLYEWVLCWYALLPHSYTWELINDLECSPNHP